MTLAPRSLSFTPKHPQPLWLQMPLIQWFECSRVPFLSLSYYFCLPNPFWWAGQQKCIRAAPGAHCHLYFTLFLIGCIIGALFNVLTYMQMKNVLWTWYVILSVRHPHMGGWSPRAQKPSSFKSKTPLPYQIVFAALQSACTQVWWVWWSLLLIFSS